MGKFGAVVHILRLVQPLKNLAKMLCHTQQLALIPVNLNTFVR
jgi:hypothetical protein